MNALDNIVSWADLTKAQQKQVTDDSGYTKEQMEFEEPVFIADYYFKEYAQELAEDIGAVDDTLGWPHSCIDWEHAARELSFDYSSVSIDGTDYLFRAW